MSLFAVVDLVFPSQDASTVQGQMAWFLCGFVYMAGIQLVALGISVFKRAAPGAEGG